MAFDSYIFDMDGTLWDAVDSYCAIWDRTLADCHVDAPAVTRSMLVPLMGAPLDTMYRTFIGDRADNTSFMRVLEDNERNMMPVLGGRLYPGVRETLEELARRTRLFMVSNCQAEGLPNFVRYCHLEGLFTDLLSYGSTGCDKEVNICYLIERYKLKSPLYVGDTAGDMQSAHAAGVPFAWAAYGFGRNVEGYEYKLDNLECILSI